MAETPKTWWAPVWRGLVADPAGKHLPALGKALGLLIYLFLHANRDTGLVYQRQATISREMGFSVRMIRAWMRRLRQGGYISMTGTGRAAVIRVARWRSLRSRRQERAGQTGNTLPLRAAETGRRPYARTPRVEHPRGESERSAEPNKSISTRVLLQQREGGQRNAATTNDGASRTVSQRREELLAADLAIGLDDRARLPRYLAHARTYPEHVLRRLLSEARAVPERDIRRSRSALFAHLLKEYD